MSAASPANAQGLHGIGFVKGCVSPTSITQPYACSYAIFNNSDTGNEVIADTLTITSLVDVVHADPSDVSSGNILPSLNLSFSGGASCNVGQTQCTLPPGSSISASPYSFYTVDSSDPNPLTDTATLTWQDTCSSGANNCPVGNQTSTAGSQSTIVKLGSATVTQVQNPSNVDITNTSVTAGTTVHDKAVVSAVSGSTTPTGTVDFNLFPNGTCTAPAASTQTGVALVAGVATSDSTTTAPGSWSYMAHYNGDATFSASDGVCEPFTVVAAPKLIVIKHVINDNGGTASSSDFTMNVTATNPSPASFPGVESPGTTVDLSAGSYSVDESGGPAGYTKTLSTDCSGTIANGETKTCTITNDDQPTHLIVIKHVINDNGGTSTAADFSLTINGIAAQGGNTFPGAESPGTDKLVSPGSYSVTEASSSMYATTYSTDCTGTLAMGETKTCTVTNDDIAQTVLVTRTLGFWQTHTSFTTKVFTDLLGSSMPIGTAPHKGVITTTGQLFGGFYASIPKTTSGTARTALDKARIQLLQQLIAAKLNCAAFGCSGATTALIASADAAYAGTSTSDMTALTGQLDAYNNSGDAGAIPSSLGSQGSATPKTSQSLADLAFWDTP
jgi:hypothetical protein